MLNTLFIDFRLTWTFRLWELWEARCLGFPSAVGRFAVHSTSVFHAGLSPGDVNNLFSNDS